MLKFHLTVYQSPQTQREAYQRECCPDLYGEGEVTLWQHRHRFSARQALLAILHLLFR